MGGFKVSFNPLKNSLIFKAIANEYLVAGNFRFISFNMGREYTKLNPLNKDMEFVRRDKKLMRDTLVIVVVCCHCWRQARCATGQKYNRTLELA